MSDPTDEDILNDVLSDEETTDSTVVAEPEQTEEPEEVVAEATEEKPPIPPKPEYRLKEDAERARAAEAENAELKRRLDALERNQPKPQVKQEEEDDGPDPLLDPKGYAKHVREKIKDELLAERREESLQRALEEKPDEFKSAYAAAQQVNDPSLKARMQAARDPGKELLKWHKEQKVKAEVGDDLEAYITRKVEERINAQARPDAQTKTPDGRPRVNLGPSLNGASRANTTLKSAQEDVSDQELFDQLTG